MKPRHKHFIIMMLLMSGCYGDRQTGSNPQPTPQMGEIVQGGVAQEGLALALACPSPTVAPGGMAMCAQATSLGIAGDPGCQFYCNNCVPGLTNLCSGLGTAALQGANIASFLSGFPPTCTASCTASIIANGIGAASALATWTGNCNNSTPTFTQGVATALCQVISCVPSSCLIGTPAFWLNQACSLGTVAASLITCGAEQASCSNAIINAQPICITTICQKVQTTGGQCSTLLLECAKNLGCNPSSATYSACLTANAWGINSCINGNMGCTTTGCCTNQLPGQINSIPPWPCGPAICGNGLIEGEACDDGNTVGGDGCSATCQIEPPPPPVCGNGILEIGETCDDGNILGGDGCSATCTVEPPPPQCGDGNLDAGEGCDDGNIIGGDGCSAACQIEPPPVCGNGAVEVGESCDDGNTNNGDGCSNACAIEPACGPG